MVNVNVSIFYNMYNFTQLHRTTLPGREVHEQFSMLLALVACYHRHLGLLPPLVSCTPLSLKYRHVNDLTTIRHRGWARLERRECRTSHWLQRYTTFERFLPRCVVYHWNWSILGSLGRKIQTRNLLSAPRNSRRLLRLRLARPVSSIRNKNTSTVFSKSTVRVAPLNELMALFYLLYQATSSAT